MKLNLNDQAVMIRTLSLIGLCFFFLASCSPHKKTSKSEAKQNSSAPIQKDSSIVIQCPAGEGIQIQLTKDNSIFLDGKAVSSENLTLALTAKVKQENKNPTIYLLALRSTPYQYYMEAQSAIESTYQTIRNGEAKRSFHLNYDQLNDKQKAQINAAHPMHVIEKVYQ